MDGVSLTFIRLELLLHEAELFFVMPQFVLESGNLSHARNSDQQQCLFDSYRQKLLASYSFLVDPPFGFSFRTPTRVSGATVYRVIFPHTFFTSKPVSRMVQASVSPLLADRTFSITVPISVRCSSSMEAPRSTSNKLSDASGWVEVIGTAGSPSFARDCLLDSGTFVVSDAVTG